MHGIALQIGCLVSKVQTYNTIVKRYPRSLRNPVLYAGFIAGTLGHKRIGPEHLLVAGLITERNLLRARGIGSSQLIEILAKSFGLSGIFGNRHAKPTEPPTLTGEAQELLALAKAKASSRDEKLRPKHLLVAILAKKNAKVSALLKVIDLDLSLL